MKRTVKAFGLAIVAALALSAMATASASAQHVTATSPANPVWVTGTSAGDQLTSAGGTITCNHAVFSGGPVATPNNKLSVTPSYTGCTAFGIANTHISDTGCKYDFELTNNHHGNSFTSGVYLNCGPNGEGHITVTPTILGFSACTVTFGTQTVNGDVTLTNQGGTPNTFAVTGSISGITYNSSGGVCGSAGTHHDGVYHIQNAVVKAYSNAGHTTQVGGTIQTVP